MRISTDWFLRIPTWKADVIESTGLRVTQAGENLTLYLVGEVLDSNMRVLADEQVLSHLGKSIDSLARFNGRFSGVLVTKNRLYCFSDRVTTCKMFFSIYDGELYAAGNPDTIARNCPRPPEENLRAISGMLMCKTMLSNETFYHDIFTTAVGEVAWVSRHDSSWRYYQYDPVFRRDVVDQRPINEIARQLYDRLAAFIHDAYSVAPERFASTITGGLDSRLLVGIAEKEGLHFPLMISDNDSFFKEYAMIRPLLRHWKTDATRYETPQDYFIHYADESINTTGSLCFSHVWFTPTAKQISQQDTRYMTGIGGGELMRIFNGNTRLLPSAGSFFGNHLQEMKANFAVSEGVLSAVLTDSFLPEMDSLYEDALRKSMQPYWGRSRGAVDWYLQTSLFNDVVYFFTMFSSSFDGFSPFLAAGILDTLFAIPLEEMQGENLYDKLFAYLNPAVNEFPSTRNIKGKAFSTRRKIHNEETVRFLCEKLGEGPLIEEGILDRHKLQGHLSQMEATEKYLASYDLRALYDIDLWFRNLVQIRKDREAGNGPKRTRKPFLTRSRR